MFQTLILNVLPSAQPAVLWDGHASSVSLPGEEGEFEVRDFHKPIISRLKKGVVVVDQNEFPIRSGIVKMDCQKLVAMVEL